jgi:Uncharacterised nucleotidyltransferase
MSVGGGSEKRRRDLHGSFWPSEYQERLLTTALGSGEDAVRAWTELGPEFVLDDIEPGCFDVMPLVYRSLTKAGYRDPVVDRMKSIYRREWVRANVLRERTREVAATLRDARVTAVFVEGAPLAGRYFPAPGLRPSWFVDCFVDRSAATLALDALEDRGWHLAAPGIRRRDATRVALLDATRNACIVRTSLADDLQLAPGDSGQFEPLLATAEAYDLEGVELLVPEPVWTLLAVCMFGARHHERTNLQWIVDAVMILRTETIALPRLFELAGARAQTLRVREALSYLLDFPGLRLPVDVREELASLRIGPRERVSFALSANSLDWAGSMPAQAARHLAARQDVSLASAIVTFPGHLRREWNVTRGWRLPYAVGVRAMRRLRVRGREA